MLSKLIGNVFVGFYTLPVLSLVCPVTMITVTQMILLIDGHHKVKASIAIASLANIVNHKCHVAQVMFN